MTTTIECVRVPRISQYRIIPRVFEYIGTGTKEKRLEQSLPSLMINDKLINGCSQFYQFVIRTNLSDVFTAIWI